MSKKLDIVKKENQYVEAAHMSKENQLVLEIKLHVDHAQKTLFNSAIEIGERLVKAKEIVKHGEWSAWLAQRVNFSQSTAGNFMALYKEYQANGLANSQTFGNLEYSKALQLIALPPEERTKFAEENNVQDMAVRELKEKITAITNEKNDLSAQLDNLKKESESVSSDKEKAEKEVKSLADSIAKMEADRQKAENAQDAKVEKKLSKALKEERKLLESAEKQAEKLTKQIEELNQKQAEKVEAIRAEEQEKAEKALAKKDKDITVLSEKFQTQLEKAKAQVQEEKGKTKEAKERAALSKGLIRCELLLYNIQVHHEELLRILDSLHRVSPEQAKEMERILADTLNVMAGIQTSKEAS